MKLDSVFVMYESLAQYNKTIYCGPSTICYHGKDSTPAAAQRAELTSVLSTSLYQILLWCKLQEVLGHLYSDIK
jgi:hypothetical protein